MVRRVLAPLAAIVVLAGAALAAVAVAGGPPPREVAVIVELEGPPALRADAARTRAAQGASARQRAAVRDAARAAGLHVRERSTYSLTFNGLAVTVPEDERAQLANLPGVAAVHPDRRMRASLGVSVPLVGAPRVWALQDAGGRPVTGTGVDVAVIDTGVDDTHPALDGGTVVGGHDFVNDDADPMDDNGHGTHVAGIVAAGGEPTGVAPGASIVAYKVLDAYGYGDSSDVIAALEAAVDPANPHRAEVVNFSLGSGEPADGPVTSAAQAAAEAGVVVVASAGNAGPAEQSVGAPAQAPGVLAVGASISGLEVPVVRMTAPRALDLRTTRWEFSANPPDQEQEVEVVDVGEGDFAAHDVRGKAVLLDAPGPPLQQALEAERRGAVALLIRAGSAGGPVSAAGERLHEFPTGSGDDGRFDSLVAVIVDDDGVAALRQALGAGPVRVEIAGEDATDQIAAFSSRGPTATFAAKPDLVAPGVEIRSTVPKALHAPGVARFSGTSMSAPHVAGAAALVRQLHPDWPASAVRSALAGASTPLEGPPLLSGAGRLDVAAAARAAVVADTTALSFGLAGTEGRTERTRVLALSNVDDETADVRIAAHAAAGAGAPVTVSPASARLAPGEQVEVTVRLAADSPAADVQGWVDVDVAGPAPDLRLPYALPVRALQVVVSPDPADDRTEAFVATPVDLDGPPVVEVRGPDGIVTRVTARHDHDQWWRAVLEGGVEGVYRVHATGRALSSLGGATLSGATTFEVAEPDQEDGSPLTWEPVGPNSIGGELDLGPGADPHTYVLDPNNPMVWVSADGAATWRARRLTTVTSGVPVELVPDARRAGTLFLAVNSTAEEPTFEGAVLRSPDDGRTWTSLPAPDIRMLDLAVTPDGDLLAAATEDGLYAGDDGGATWEPVEGPWTRVEALQLVGDDLFAATDQGLFVVDGFADGGRTPRRIDAGGASRYDDVDGDARLLVASTGFNLRGSHDGGRTWEPLFTPPDGGRVWALSVVGRTAYASTFQGFYVGERDGTRWDRRVVPLRGLVMGDVERRPSGPGLLAALPGGGVFTTEDGGRTYERVGVPGVPVVDLAMAENRSGQPWLIAGTKFDTYRTAVPSKSQIRAEDLEWGFSGADGAYDQSTRVAAAPSRPRVVYKAAETPLAVFSIHRSDDGGETWRRIGQGNDTATAVYVDPHDPDRAIVGFWAFTGSGMLVTEDGGATWRRIRRDAPPAAIVADPRDGDRLWLADAAGLHQSTDGGATFTKRHDVPLGSVQLDPADPDRLIAGGSALYVSEDGGATLRRAFYADLAVDIADLVFDPRRHGVAYAAAACSSASGLPRAGRGVLRSTDGGRTWSSFAEGLDTPCVRTLALAPDGRYLFAGTATAGVHRIKLRGGG